MPKVISSTKFFDGVVIFKKIEDRVVVIKQSDNQEHSQLHAAWAAS